MPKVVQKSSEDVVKITEVCNKFHALLKEDDSSVRLVIDSLLYTIAMVLFLNAADPVASAKDAAKTIKDMVKAALAGHPRSVEEEPVDLIPVESLHHLATTHTDHELNEHPPNRFLTLLDANKVPAHIAVFVLNIIMTEMLYMKIDDPVAGAKLIGKDLCRGVKNLVSKAEVVMERHNDGKLYVTLKEKEGALSPSDARTLN